MSHVKVDSEGKKTDQSIMFKNIRTLSVALLIVQSGTNDTDRSPKSVRKVSGR